MTSSTNTAYLDDTSGPERLALCIAQDAPILMVGAGLSNLVGYPGWGKLLNDLKSKTGSIISDTEMSDLQDQPDSLAEKVYELIDDSRKNDWFAFLRERFHPDGANCRPIFLKSIHQRLVELPFSGIVTTNYDRVMEMAAQEVIYGQRTSFAQQHVNTSMLTTGQCTHIDVCTHSNRETFYFIRKLSTSRPSGFRDQVLHLHGYYEHPEKLILTKSQYERYYGCTTSIDTYNFTMVKNSQKWWNNIASKFRSWLDGVVKEYSQANTPSSFEQPVIAGSTYHSKVLWALLASRPFVFMGFGMEDPFFMQVMKTLKDDFCLGSALAVKPLHFAVMPAGKVKETFRKDLAAVGIEVIEYPFDSKVKPDAYRVALESFIDQLVRLVHEKLPSPFDENAGNPPSENENHERVGVGSDVDDDINPKNVFKILEDLEDSP